MNDPTRMADGLRDGAAQRHSPLEWKNASREIRQRDFNYYAQKLACGQDVYAFSECLQLGLSGQRTPQRLRLLTWMLLQFSGPVPEKLCFRTIETVLRTLKPQPNADQATLDVLAQTLRLIAVKHYSAYYWDCQAGRVVRPSDKEDNTHCMLLLGKWQTLFASFTNLLSSPETKYQWLDQAVYQLVDVTGDSLMMYRWTLTGGLVLLLTDKLQGTLAAQAAHVRPLKLARTDEILRARRVLQRFAAAWQALTPSKRQRLTDAEHAAFQRGERHATQVAQLWLSAWLLANACDYTADLFREQAQAVMGNGALSDRMTRLYKVI